jgi:hypothetical protein
MLGRAIASDFSWFQDQQIFATAKFGRNRGLVSTPYRFTDFQREIAPTSSSTTSANGRSMVSALPAIEAKAMLANTTGQSG